MFKPEDKILIEECEDRSFRLYVTDKKLFEMAREHAEKLMPQIRPDSKFALELWTDQSKKLRRLGISKTLTKEDWRKSI